MKWITKGNWFYEIQILMIVIMWRHDDYIPDNYPLKNDRGIVIGRLHIWRDKMWLHSFGLKIGIQKILNSKLVRALISIRCLFELMRAGFWIGGHEDVAGVHYIRYRFFWKDKSITDMGDISYVGGHWNTMLKGSSKALTYDIVKDRVGPSYYSKEYPINMEHQMEDANLKLDIPAYLRYDTQLRIEEMKHFPNEEAQIHYNIKE